MKLLLGFFLSGIAYFVLHILLEDVFLYIVVGLVSNAIDEVFKFFFGEKAGYNLYGVIVALFILLFGYTKNWVVRCIVFIILFFLLYIVDMLPLDISNRMAVVIFIKSLILSLVLLLDFKKDVKKEVA